jgi:hypothetical protein
MVPGDALEGVQTHEVFGIDGDEKCPKRIVVIGYGSRQSR